jgi:hypothetical protein
MPDDSTKHDALYEAHQRVCQLEALNATLAAQLDRQARVVEAAQTWNNCKYGSDEESVAGMRLSEIVNDYDDSMAQLVREECCHFQD